MTRLLLRSAALTGPLARTDGDRLWLASWLSLASGLVPGRWSIFTMRYRICRHRCLAPLPSHVRPVLVDRLRSDRGIFLGHRTDEVSAASLFSQFNGVVDGEPAYRRDSVLEPV